MCLRSSLPKLRNAKLGDLAHLTLRLTTHFVTHPPPQLDRLDLLALIAGMPYLDRLRDTTTLLGLQRASCLWLERRLVSLDLS